MTKRDIDQANQFLQAAEERIADNDMPTALLFVEKALHAAQAYEPALRRGLDLSVQLHRYALSMVFRRQLLELDLDPEERIAQLRALVHDGAFLAIESLEALRAQPVEGFDTLDRLRAAYEAVGNRAKATDVMVAQAESVPSPHERAAAMVRAADFCAGRAMNTPRAVALYEAAIADDPAIPGAFEAIERVLVENADWAELEKAYLRQAERLEEAGEKQALAQLLGRLAELRHDRRNDRTGAIDALSRRVNLEPANVDARLVLAALLEHAEQWPRAARVLETACWHAPTNTTIHHALYRNFTQRKEHDRAFQACAALVHLGDADLDKQMLYQQYRPEAGLRPTATVDDACWAELYPLEHDANVRALLAAIGPAAISHKVDALRAAGKLPTLDPKQRQDPETSTVSVVRSLAWAAKLLQIQLPPLHVRPDLASGISAVPLLEPAIVLGKAVLSGRSIAELAFLVGRDLTYFRPEHRILMHYSSMPELTTLVTTAIRIAKSGPGGAASIRDQGLAAALSRGIDATAWERVRAAVDRVESSGAKIDLTGYVRSLEIAATRVGLLLSGDLPTAGKLLSTDVREVAGLRAADRMRDLLPYAVSAQYAALRVRLGVAAS